MRALCWLVLFVMACGGPAKPAPAVPPPATHETVAHEPSASPSPAPAEIAQPAPPPPPPPPEPAKPIAPTVRVFDAGAAPRLAIRYQFKPGASESVEADMKMSIELAMGGDPSHKSDLPTVRMSMRVVVTDLTPDGDAHITFDLERVTVLEDVVIDRAMRQKLEADLGQLVGMRGSSRVSSRGIQSEAVFQLPNASPAMIAKMDNLRESIRQMYVPLPEGEVGKGARWEVTSRVPLQTALMDLKMTYTLSGVSRALASFDVETAMSAQRQPMQVAPGMTSMLESLTGGGGGKMSLATGRLVATGAAKVTSDAAFSITTGAETLRTTMKMTAAMTTRQVKPAKR